MTSFPAETESGQLSPANRGLVETVGIEPTRSSQRGDRDRSRIEVVRFCGVEHRPNA